MIPESISRISCSLQVSAPAGGMALMALAMAVVSGCGGAEDRGGAPSMSIPETIGEWVRQPDPVSYDRETIFDYIDGAGEVYRSYAFETVDVERYEREEGEGLTVEIFDMGNAEDAFGVFSYAREEEEEGIGAGFERRGSVLCFWQDRFYVCVAAEQRYDDPAPVLEEVARGVSAALPSGGEKPALVAALPPRGRVPASDRYFHLHQTLGYHYYLVRENVLNLSPDTDGVLARYTPGPMYLVMIRYDDPGGAAAALRSFREALAPGSGEAGTVPWKEGKFLSTAQEGPFGVIVLDAPSPEDAEALRQAALDRLAQLPR